MNLRDIVTNFIIDNKGNATIYHITPSHMINEDIVQQTAEYIINTWDDGFCVTNLISAVA